TRGCPPITSAAAFCSASRWCCVSQSRENRFGAPIRRWSPSTASRRQGRTQESITAGASLCEAQSRRRVQRLSSTGEDLTYAHSYPQLGITSCATFDGVSAPARPYLGTVHFTRSPKRRNAAR